MKWAEIAFFRPFYISFSHPKSSPISIYSFFPFTFHTHCVSMIYIDFILHVAFTLLSHLILPLAKGQGDVPSAGTSMRMPLFRKAM